jgi:hypothetical protein
LLRQARARQRLVVGRDAARSSASSSTRSSG